MTKMRKATVCVLLVSLLLVGLGIYRDEVATVLNKGINLCLECVGIG